MQDPQICRIAKVHCVFVGSKKELMCSRKKTQPNCGLYAQIMHTCASNLPREQVGAGNTLIGWDLAVRNMSKGERAILLVRSDFGYGDMAHTMRSGAIIM